MRYFSFIIVAVCLLGCASKEDKAIDAINKYMYICIKPWMIILGMKL